MLAGPHLFTASHYTRLFGAKGTVLDCPGALLAEPQGRSNVVYRNRLNMQIVKQPTHSISEDKYTTPPTVLPLATTLLNGVQAYVAL